MNVNPRDVILGRYYDLPDLHFLPFLLKLKIENRKLK